jgi:hypothetical protein
VFKQAKPAPPVVRFLTDELVTPEAAQLTSLLRVSDYTGAIAHLRALPTWEARALAIQDGVPPDVLMGVVQVAQTTGDPTLLTIAGEASVQHAWQLRGKQRAEHVSREAFDRFFEALRYADRLLIMAGRRDPASPLPWLSLLASGRGLEIAKEELCLRYDMIARHGTWQSAQLALVQGLCPKWGGSADDLLGFARLCSTEAPVASPLHASLAMAHFELSFENKSCAFDVWAANEILEAADRSVRQPSFVTEPNGGPGRTARNIFGALFARMGRYDLVREQLVGLDFRPNEFPWNYMADPTAVVTRAMNAR